MSSTVLLGDCLGQMRFWLEDDSIDAIVTDPPYGLRFMGKKWDYDVPSVEKWAECLRVLKPGGHMLAFGGSRTYHRLVCNVEDAGFEVRDQVLWVYGSGFPKSRNGEWGGTALKPAIEPIVLARKPFSGTVKDNWRKWGTGALNIDGCRIATDENLNGGAYAKNATPRDQMWGAEAGNSYVRGGAGEFVQPAGRWPANLIHDGSDEVLAAFPQAAGQQAPVSGTAPSDKTSNVYGRMKRQGEASADSDNTGVVGFKMKPGMRRLDSGSAARFFYCAKASKSDRGPGNKHETVKPTDLMRYLCRLVTPPGGLVLDPFMGSGSTGVAAILEGFDFIGIERDEDGEGNRLGYLDIAEARIAAAKGAR